jgi:HlyD family secretion protein
MKKTYLYIIIGVVVVGTAGYFLFFNSGSAEITYRTEKITKGDITIQVRATGTINPVKTVAVGSQVSGIIEKIYVDFNSNVRQGQVIAQIDSTAIYASVKQAEANVERNQAQVNDATRTLNRSKELFAKNLISQADLDAATTAYESAVAQLKQTKAALDQSKVNLRYAIIRSPIDGVVISRDVDVGQTVASSFQTPKLFSIANDLKRMQVEASVDEADIGQIKVGQSVTFTVDAYQDEQFTGNVSQVRLSPITVQNVVTYTVIIDVPNPELKLRPGMTATVSILINKREGVTRVPALAVRFQPSQDVLEKLQESKSDAGSRPSAQNMQRDRSDTIQKNSQQQSGEMRQGSDRSWKQRGERMASKQNSSQSPDVAQIAKPSQPPVKTSTVWILENGRKPKPLKIKTGISDNRFVEVLSDELKPGDEVIVGSTNGSTTSAAQQTNPFGPQRMMGPGGGGAGGRGR